MSRKSSMLSMSMTIDAGRVNMSLGRTDKRAYQLLAAGRDSKLKDFGGVIIIAVITITITIIMEHEDR
jgi:hypothetical protein